MLAKEKPEILRRALISVSPLISCYLVSVEPGDPLGALVPGMMPGLPGDVVEFERQNGAQARTDLMRAGETTAAKYGAEFLLNLDADDELAIGSTFAWPEMDADVYDVQHRDEAGFEFRFPRLFRVGLPWRWVGVLHEVPQCVEPFRHGGLLQHVLYLRHIDQRGPERYVEHARILAEELEQNPTDARTAFYLAQSYRDAHQWEDALAAYDRRAQMPGWVEETYAAVYWGAMVAAQCSRPFPEVMHRYLSAWAVAPWRAEPLYWLAVNYSRVNMPVVACFYADKAASIPEPANGLFVETAVYRQKIGELQAQLEAKA